MSKYCQDCGAELKEGYRFCGKCGKEIIEVKRVEPLKLTTEKEPIVQKSNEIKTEKEENLNQLKPEEKIPRPVESKNTSKTKHRQITFVLGAMFIVIGIIIVIYLLSLGGNNYVPSTVNNPSSNTPSSNTPSSNNPPSASFYYSVSGQTIYFTDTSRDYDGSIRNYYWTFGDGSTSYSENPTHAYITDGIYTVTLEVTDDDGATDSASQTIIVTIPPNFQVVDYTTRDTLEGANRVGYVNVTVKNSGGAGTDTISVTVCQGNNQWTKSQTVTLGVGESTSFTLRFPEINFWTADQWYVCSTQT